MGTLLSKLLGPFLILITTNLVAKVMTALGAGIVSYAALTTVVSAYIEHVNASFSGAGGLALALFQLSGFMGAVGILCGALTTKAVLVSVNKIIPGLILS